MAERDATSAQPPPRVIRTLPYALAVPIWIATLLEMISRARGALAFGAAGDDLRPMYLAGLAVLHGRPVYEVAYFVYPPTAAIA